jgi:hypothetical protein
MLNYSVKEEQTYLPLDFMGKQCFIFMYNATCIFSVDAIIKLKFFSLFLFSWEFFIYGYWALSNVFSASVYISIYFSSSVCYWGSLHCWFSSIQWALSLEYLDKTQQYNAIFTPHYSIIYTHIVLLHIGSIFIRVISVWFSLSVSLSCPPLLSR